MLNIDSLETGIVIDHIQAGTSMRVYDLLKLEKLELPLYVKNVIKCRNPRCITTIEEGIDQVFKLCDPEKRRYRCIYCEQEYNTKRLHEL